MRGGALPLILARIAISTQAGALTSMVLNLSPNPFAANEIIFWMMGSLADRSMLHVWMPPPFFVSGAAMVLATELSGREGAHVLIARILAQETPLLVADEPVASLDPAAQNKVMETFAGIAAQGRAVLASLHDLGLAARHCIHLVLLSQGHIAADGPPETVLQANTLAHTFDITAWFDNTPKGPVFQPIDILNKEKT